MFNYRISAKYAHDKTFRWSVGGNGYLVKRLIRAVYWETLDEAQSICVGLQQANPDIQFKVVSVCKK